MNVEPIVRFLVRKARLLFALGTLLAVVAGYRAVRTYQNLRSDLEELLPNDAPSVRALAEARRRLPGLRHLGVVVDTGGPEHAAQALRFISDLEARVRTYPPSLVSEVRSGIGEERNFVETHALSLMEPGDVRALREAVEARHRYEVGRATGLGLLDDDEAPPAIPVRELEQKYQAKAGGAANFPDGRFLSDDGRTAVLVIRSASSATSLGVDEQLLDRVKADIAALHFPAAYAADMRVGFAGDIATRVEEARGLESDLGVSGAVVLTLVLAALGWYFRSFAAVVTLVVPVIYGALYTFGVVALPPLSIRQLNSNTAFLSSIIIGNGINAGIILLARFHEQQRQGDPLERALAVAWQETWRPTLGASAAASASYASLLVTAFRGFNQFGWIGAFGMLLCWAATYALAPVLIVLFGERRFHAQVSKPAAASRFASRLVVEHPRWVVGTAGVLLAISLGGLFARRNDWLETNFSHLRRADSFQTGERYWGPRMDATLKTYLTPAVIMTNSREAAERAAAAVTALAQQGGAGGLIGRVRTADDVLPPHRDEALAEARLLARALTPAMLSSLSPADRARVERMTSPEALKPLTAADVPRTLVAGLLDKNGNIDRNVLVFPTLGPATWDARKIAEFSRDLREVAASVGDHASVVGSLTLSADIVAAMRRDGPLATASAMVAVLLVALLAFRSIGLSVSAMASLAVGVTLMLGLAAWSGQRINFSNLIALPITFGVAADYSINVLRRFQAHGDIGEAVGRTGGAVALCSTTTIIGFASLVVARNRALRSFGDLAISGELACLATAVLVLPAFLAWRARRPTLELPNVPNAHDAGSRP